MTEPVSHLVRNRSFPLPHALDAFLLQHHDRSPSRLPFLVIPDFDTNWSLSL